LAAVPVCCGWSEEVDDVVVDTRVEVTRVEEVLAGRDEDEELVLDFDEEELEGGADETVPITQ
jgi:hypothetical protein